MSRKHTQEEVISSLLEFGYQLLDEYKNIHTPMTLKCPLGHIVKMSYASFFHQGSRCKYCVGNNIKYTIDEVKNWLKDIGYTLLDNFYVNAHTKMNLLCDNGHLIDMTFHSLKSGQRCRLCAGNNIRHSLEYVRTQLSKYGYTLLTTNYKNNKQKLDIMCKYGHKFKMSFNNFSNGERCPICAGSKGEREISYFLTKNNIEYNFQYRFNDCRDVLPLPFDFYIASKNICIEYQGEQHYKAVDFSHGSKTQQELELDLNEVKRRDQIKVDYCLYNNIKLLCIPYWDFNNIEQILKNENVI